jgi:hypothetical protein
MLRIAKDFMKTTLSRDDSVDLQAFMPGDTVRRHDEDDDDCVIVWLWRDWLWLDPVEYRGAAPFTGRAHDYQLVRRGQR